MRISLQRIAEELGFNRSTISRSLRHDPRIPLETRKRIQAACREMGYKPNSLISELAASRWQAGKSLKGSTLAYVDCTRLAIGFGPNFGSALDEQAAVYGYRTETFRMEEIGSSAKLQRTFRNRGITDIILGPVFEESLLLELDWSKFICVQLAPGLFRRPLHSVVKDHFNAVVLAWEKAVSHGYRRIGIVLFQHPHPLRDDVLRISAARACQTEFFPHFPALPVLRHGTFASSHTKEFVDWVKANEPDVIIGFSDGHYHIFQAAFGHYLPYISLHTTPPFGLSGISNEARTGAKEAVNLLHFCRRTYQWGIAGQQIDHVIEPVWFEGTTLPMKGN
jgi:DNA-binding LacI/PurR family transcriptional regulator